MNSSSEINSRREFRGEAGHGEFTIWLQGTPLPWLKSLESTTLQKNPAQNLHNKDLRSQNLESMGLRGRFLAASALADIAASTPLPGQSCSKLGLGTRSDVTRCMVRCHKVMLWKTFVPELCSGYLQSTLLSWAAAICHLPLRFNQVSVQTWHCFASGWVLSLPIACSLP